MIRLSRPNISHQRWSNSLGLRSFSSENKSEQTKTTQTKKVDSDDEKDQVKGGKKVDESKKEEEWSDDEQEKKEFKTYRKVLFALGKAFKYTMWASFALFLYHLYVVVYSDKPE